MEGVRGVTESGGRVLSRMVLVLVLQGIIGSFWGLIAGSVTAISSSAGGSPVVAAGGVLSEEASDRGERRTPGILESSIWVSPSITCAGAIRKVTGEGSRVVSLLCSPAGDENIF